MLLITSGQLPTRLPPNQKRAGRAAAAELGHLRKAAVASIRQRHEARVRRLELKGWSVVPMSCRNLHDGERRYRCETKLTRPASRHCLTLIDEADESAEVQAA